jgi:hypothetical protein
MCPVKFQFTGCADIPQLSKYVNEIMPAIQHTTNNNTIHNPFKYYYTLIALGHLPTEATLAVYRMCTAQ